MAFKADKFIKSASGPMAAVKYCTLCDYFVKYPKGVRGAGRGYGLAQGGKAIADLRRHVRDEHPEAMKEAP